MKPGSAGRMLLIAVLAVAHPAAAPRAQETASACPHFLQAWVVMGGFEGGEDWTARLVTIRNDRARLEELRIRSETPKISDTDSRWFMPEDFPDPEPIEVGVGSKVLLGETLQSMCKELTGVGLGSIQSKAMIDEQRKSPGMIDAKRIEVTVTDIQEGMRVGVHATPAPAKAKVGSDAAAGNVGVRKESLVLDQENLSEDGEDADPKAPPPAAPTPEATKAKARSKAILTAVRTITERYSRSIAAAPNDFSSVPAARRILETLDGVDDAGLPSDLPSPFLLESAAAPREYAVALALEVLAREDDEDESSDRTAALRKLGDQATPAAVEDLVLVLQEPTLTKPKQVEAALAMRALLKADPDQARMQAVRLLSGSRPVARAALGVFAATEKAFSQELALLDLGDPKKVLDVTTRLKRHLVDSATEPALRKAAGGR